MRHRGWVDVAALLLMAGAAWLVYELVHDGEDGFAAIYDSFPQGAAGLSPYHWVPLFSAGVLALASVAMLVAARVPRLARSSPRPAGVLVLLGGTSLVVEWVRYLSLVDDIPKVRASTYFLPAAGVACTAALTAGIALPLLRGRRSGPAVTGAALVWGVLVAAVLVRNPVRRPEVATIPISVLEPGRVWVVPLAGLLVIAAGLLVTAWFAGPPAGRERVLARCRGGYGAVALLLLPTLAFDLTLASVRSNEVAVPMPPGLVLHAWLVFGVVVAAAAAALVPRATPVLAAVVPAFGLAAGAVIQLRDEDDFLFLFTGVFPVLAGAIVPVLLAATVAYACRRLPPEAPREEAPAEPAAAPVA